MSVMMVPEWLGSAGGCSYCSSREGMSRRYGLLRT